LIFPRLTVTVSSTCSTVEVFVVAVMVPKDILN
jgi:hypothetical protein